MNKVRLPLLAVVAMYICCLPAVAETILFNDLSSAAGGKAYSTTIGWSICGSGAKGCFGVSYGSANSFTVAGIGAQPVSEINLAVTHAGTSSELQTFSAAIWNGVSGIPRHIPLAEEHSEITAQ